MAEEQCLRPRKDGNMRPPRGYERKRITGWLAGHTIHLETEEVSWIKKMATKGHEYLLLGEIEHSFYLYILGYRV